MFTLQTLPDCRPDNPRAHTVGKVASFSLHARVATRAHEREKLERLCRYIAWPAASIKRLSLTRQGKVRYELKVPYNDGTTHVLFEPLEFISRLVNAVSVGSGRVSLSPHFVRASINEMRSDNIPASGITCRTLCFDVQHERPESPGFHPQYDRSRGTALFGNAINQRKWI